MHWGEVQLPMMQMERIFFFITVCHMVRINNLTLCYFCFSDPGERRAREREKMWLKKRVGDVNEKEREEMMKVLRLSRNNRFQSQFPLFGVLFNTYSDFD